MRYVSAAKGLALITKDGTVKYTFHNGVLIMGGDPVGEGTGEVILPDLSGSESSALQKIFPDASTDLEKVGLGVLFWKSPELTEADAIVVGNYYRVIRGEIVHDGVTYKAGGPSARFKATATSFTGDGVIGFDVPAIYYKEEDLNNRKENYKIHHTLYGDESSWDDSVWEGTEQSSTFTR